LLNSRNRVIVAGPRRAQVHRKLTLNNKVKSFPRLK
jgi:hypothetical protein